MREAGVWWDDTALRFGPSPLHGAGVFARRNISQGEVLATIPASACLGSHTCGLKHQLDALIADGTLDDELALVVAVLYELRRGRRSRWAGYLACLKHDRPHTPQSWARKQQRWLSGTECDRSDVAGWHCGALRKRRGQSLGLLKRMGPLLRRLLPKGAQSITFPEFATAVYWSESRAFSLNGAGEVLCPLADLFNHKSARVPRRGGLQAYDNSRRYTGPAVSAPRMDVAICVGRAGREHQVSIVSVSPMEEGCEVFNCYGEYGNAKLLADYGFCCTNNPYDVVRLRPADLVRAAAAVQRLSRAEVRRRLTVHLSPWRFVGAAPVRREAVRDDDGGGSSSDSGDEEEHLRGFGIGLDGAPPPLLRRVAAVAAGLPNTKRSGGRLPSAATALLQRAAADRRRELRQANIHSGSGQQPAKDLVTGGKGWARYALASHVRRGELRILRSLERWLKQC